eukprot:403343471
MEQQMKINLIESIFNQSKNETERDVRKVDAHLAKIEKKINLKNTNVTMDLSPTKQQKQQLKQHSKHSKFGSIGGGSIQEKKSSMMSTEVEIDEKDKDDLQRTKLRLLTSNLGGPAMDIKSQTQPSSISPSKVKNKLASNPAVLKKLRQEQGQLNMFKRNVDNAEKLLMQFKGNEHQDLDPKRKHIIMKLCNDEGAYLNYKKGKIDFGVEKKQPKFQEKRNNKEGMYFSRRKKQSLDNPGDLVADPDEVVDRLYLPKRNTSVSIIKKKSWMDFEERTELMKEIKVAQQYRNYEILKKLQHHMDEREKLHEQIEQSMKQKNASKIQFSKEGISNIKFDRINYMLEETLNKLHQYGINKQLSNKTAVEINQQNQSVNESDSESEKSNHDQDQNLSVSLEPSKEKKTLEKFRLHLQEKKRLKKIAEYQRRKELRSKENSNTILSIGGDSPRKGAHNQDILVVDDSPKKSIKKSQHQVLQSLNFSSLTLANEKLEKSSKLMTTQLRRGSVELQCEDLSPKISVKDELKKKKFKYKVPALQIIRHPNYYVWGDPIHKQRIQQSTPPTIQQSNYYLNTKTQMQSPLLKQALQVQTANPLNQISSVAVIREKANESRLSTSHYNSRLEKPNTPQFLTEPFNFKFKPSTPKFPQPHRELNDSRGHSRFTKRGSVSYGLDDSKSGFYQQSLNNSQPGLQSINTMNLSNSQQLQSDLFKVKQFIQDCLRNESDEGERTLDKKLIYEEIRHDRMKELCSFLEQHNYVSANQLSLFLKKRKSEVLAQKEDIKDSIIDYKLGIMDPSREAAGIEKQQNIKKNVGKKLRYNKIEYKI